MLLIALKGGEIAMAAHGHKSGKKSDAPRKMSEPKRSGRDMSFRIFRLAEKKEQQRGVERALRKQLLYGRTLIGRKGQDSTRTLLRNQRAKKRQFLRG
jgi:hypothetical protein